MNPNLTTTPATTTGLAISPDSTALFAGLGYFWLKMFQDSSVVKGMTMAQADSVLQGYYKLVELINSYSCYNIPVFETRRWYPLFVYRSSLNNELLFGEGVNFGDEVSAQPYLFGAAVPATGVGVVSMLVPKELKAAPLIADQIISPNHVLTLDVDYTLADGRLTFNYNPFLYSNIAITAVYNEDGTPKTYSYIDSDGTIHDDQPDQLIMLWVYNAAIDDKGLDYNIGYLFGLNVPHTSNGKAILTTIVQNYTNGCTINDIKAMALACVGQTPYTAESETGLPAYNDVPASVQLFDRVNTPGWWETELGLFNGDLLPLRLPITILLGSYKNSLQFTNSVSMLFMDAATGAISFSAGAIIGNQSDIYTYLQSISTPEFVAALERYLGYSLANTSYTASLNFVDFLFRSHLQNTTALLRIKFTNLDQLAKFVNYFDAIKATLPPHILLLVLCDYSIPNEVVYINGVGMLNDTATTTGGNGNLSNGLLTANVAFAPVDFPTDDVLLNSSGPGLSIADMNSTRNLLFFSSLQGQDVRNINFTIPS